MLAQTGCNTGEKCTWIWDERDANAELGHIGCVMDGTVAADAMCTFNMDPIGFDNCVAGSFCLDGVCKEICDNNGGQPMCPSNKSCGAYSGVFGAAGQPVAAGLCDQKCDPLSQRLLGSDGNPDPAHEACDSPTPQGTGSATGSGSSAGPEQGCYTADFIDFTCASTPEGRGTDVANTLVDRAACTPANGCAFDSTQFFTNGCDPGFVSFFLDTTGSSQVDCTRLCAPLESDKTMPLANAKGDDTVAGKLPDDAAPVAGHAACIAGSEECRFLWQFITDPNTGDPSTSTYNDTLGVCFEVDAFKYDPTGGSNATVTEPSCTKLLAGSGSDIISFPDNVACDGTTNMQQDCYAVFHGCYKLADSQLTAPADRNAEVVNGKQLAARFHAYLGDIAKLRRVRGLR